jgi:hypothetical protein
VTVIRSSHSRLPSSVRSGFDDSGRIVGYTEAVARPNFPLIRNPARYAIHKSACGRRRVSETLS